KDSPAVGILMACATAWMSALLARMAERPSRERLINVADESWKIVQHTGRCEWFQSNFKLARQFGVMKLVVVHKLVDLLAAGDAADEQRHRDARQRREDRSRMSVPRHEGISDVAVLVAIGSVAAVASVLWLWGGLAGALFGSGWPRVGVDQLLAIVIRLPSR